MALIRLPTRPRLPTQPSPPSYCICRPSAQRSSSSAEVQLSQAWTLLLKEIMSLATCQAGGLTVEHHDTWKKIWDIDGFYVILPQDRWETYKFMDFTLFYQP